LPKTTENRPSKNASSYEMLLLEDNLVNQRVLAKQLSKAGCVVYVTNHGVEAPGVIESSPFATAATSLLSILFDIEYFIRIFRHYCYFSLPSSLFVCGLLEPVFGSFSNYLHRP